MESLQDRLDAFNAARKKLDDVLARWWRSLGDPEFVPLLKDRPSADIRPSVTSDLDEFLEAIVRQGRASEEFEKGYLDLERGKAAEDWLDGLVRFTQRLEEIIDGAERWARNLSTRMQAVVEELAKQEWFLHPQFPLAGRVEWVEVMLREQPELIQGTLVDFFRGRLDDIELELVRSYPNRERILRDAFQAHREGKYTLSVPVFLAQADGITHDITRKHVFQQSTREDICKSLPPSEYGFAEAILHLLVLRKSPLWKPGQRSSSQDLNRHGVLHGTSVDYDNEVNSLKAVSFLAWVHWAMSYVNKAVGGETD